MLRRDFFRGIGISVLLLGLAAAGFNAPLHAAEGDTIKAEQGDLAIHPINHATFSMQWNGKTVLVDPVGGAKPFAGLPKADLILVTDIHGDHMSGETLTALLQPGTVILAPQAVAEKLPEPVRKQTTVVANGESKTVAGIKVEAVPMYNLTAERLKFHNKGRGNGYVVTLGGKRVYISGDTEDIPEMRALKNIDVAFVCMNLPYTMTEAQAASAVREFKPKIVYPYHYRGSDLEKFKSAVGDAGEVRIRDWYKK